MITSTMTVRDVGLQLPQSTRLFEKFKIDYCCGGNRSLDEACASAGIEIDRLIEMLETANAATKHWSRLPKYFTSGINRTHTRNASRLHPRRDGASNR